MIPRGDAHVGHAEGLAEGVARLVQGGQEACELLAELPVLLAHGATQQADALLRGGGELVERVKDEEVAAGGLERAPLEGFFEEFLGRRQVVEQGAPGADLGFAGTLDDDVEVLLERGEEGEDAGEDGAFRGGRRGHVDFFVEDVVEEDFEGVGKVF